MVVLEEQELSTTRCSSDDEELEYSEWCTEPFCPVGQGSFSDLGRVLRVCERFPFPPACYSSADGPQGSCDVPENGDRIWVCSNRRLHSFSVLSLQVCLSVPLHLTRSKNCHCLLLEKLI